MITNFLSGRNENIKKSSFVWNTTGGMLNAFQSVIFLMIMTRTVGVVAAGIFTIAYAVANLMLTIGKYGVRNYQVTDIRELFSFNDYLSSRVISSILMLVASIVYVLYTSYSNDYSAYKTSVIIVLCLMKLVDSVEDVFHGYYQQHGRLDVAGKCMTIRMIIMITVYIACLFITQDLLLASIIATIVSLLIFLVLNHYAFRLFETGKVKLQMINSVEILKICLPLFLATFLNFYIINAPKFAIDSILNEELQAYYGFISMPVFVIGLLNGFIYQPQLTSLTKQFNDNRYKEFKQSVRKQSLVVTLLTLIVIAGSYLIGTPVLSVLYSVNLNPYKIELVVLMLGGGFLGLSGYFVSVLTLMRKQKPILIGYIITAVLAYFFSPLLVDKYELLGASCLYTLLTAILTLIFVAIYEINIFNRTNKE